MSELFRQINENDFDNLKAEMLFSDSQVDNCYGLISSGQFTFKFSWTSDLISPDICEIELGKHAVGIDNHTAVVDLKIGEILLNVKLDFFFCGFLVLPRFFYIISELEVVEIEKTSFAISKRVGLPDVAKSYYLHDSGISIVCQDDQVIYIN